MINLISFGLPFAIALQITYLAWIVYHVDVVGRGGDFTFPWFVIFQIFSNWIQFFRHPSYLKKPSSTLPSLDILYCHACNMLRPNKRTHHCVECNHCVLDRDHHCFVLGGCVGLKNQVYFIVFLFYAALGAICTVIWLLPYMENKHFLSAEIIDFFFPIVLIKWIFSYATLLDVGVTFAMNIGATSSIAGYSFFFWEMFLSLTGMTMFEMSKCPSVFSHLFTLSFKGVIKNFKVTFGKYCFLHFLLPLNRSSRYDLKYT